MQHGVRAEPLRQEVNPRTVGDAIAGCGEIDGRADLERLPRRVEHDGGGAELAGGMDRHDELRPVRRHDRDAVTPSYPPRREVLGQRVGGPVQFPVGPAVVAGQDGDVVGELLGGRLEPVMHEARCHGETFFSEIEIQRQHQ